MAKKKEIPNHGIYLDINQIKLKIILVLFAIFFLAPVISYQFYLSTQRHVTTEETYTKNALNTINNRTVIAVTEAPGQPQVAGISTDSNVSLPKVLFTIPGLQTKITSDFSDPANLMLIIGGFIGLTSLVILVGYSFDLFKH
ncbi:MAG: hypothetical protein WCJ58_04280 [bacterium]